MKAKRTVKPKPPKRYRTRRVILPPAGLTEAQPRQWLLPVSAEFKIDRLVDLPESERRYEYAGGLCNFTYTETFRMEGGVGKETADRTAEMVRAVLKDAGTEAEVTTTENSITMKAERMALQNAANFIVSEFAMWSPVANLSLREILCGNVAARARALQAATVQTAHHLLLKDSE